MIALGLPGLTIEVRSEFDGPLGGLPVTYEVASIAAGPAPDLIIELVRAPERNGVAPAADHPRFAARRDGDALIVERPDVLGRIDVTGSPLRARFELSDDPYALEACVRVAISVALPRHGGLILHASSVRWQGRAHVFTGVSGAGKSTIAALLAASFPACDRLADELVIVARSRAGAWRLHVPPFLGISELPRGESAPLEAIHLIAQAPEPRRTPLETGAALRELLRHVVVYAAEPQTTARVLDLAATLVGEIACDRLEFAVDRSVGDVLGIT